MAGVLLRSVEHGAGLLSAAYQELGRRSGNAQSVPAAQVERFLSGYEGNPAFASALGSLNALAIHLAANGEVNLAEVEGILLTALEQIGAVNTAGPRSLSKAELSHLDEKASGELLGLAQQLVRFGHQTRAETLPSLMLEGLQVPTPTVDEMVANWGRFILSDDAEIDIPDGWGIGRRAAPRGTDISVRLHRLDQQDGIDPSLVYRSPEDGTLALLSCTEGESDARLWLFDASGRVMALAEMWDDGSVDWITA